MPKTKHKPAQAPADKGPKNALEVGQRPEETLARAIARSIIEPAYRHGMGWDEIN